MKKNLSQTEKDFLQQPLVEGEDFYWEKNFMVFTEKYHQKRGYCCGSGCRHCPFLKKKQPVQTANFFNF